MSSRNRRFFTVYKSTVEKAKALAAAEGKSLSQMVREWVEDYAAADVPLEPVESKVDMQITIDPDVAQRAEQIVRSRDGLTLRDVIEARIRNS